MIAPPGPVDPPKLLWSAPLTSIGLASLLQSSWYGRTPLRQGKRLDDFSIQDSKALGDLFQEMADFLLDAFFGNVFPPKGAQKNSPKCGVWGF